MIRPVIEQNGGHSTDCKANPNVVAAGKHGLFRRPYFMWVCRKLDLSFTRPAVK
jgi:hypothetical protein